MHRAIGEHARQALLVAEQLHRAHAKTDRLRASQCQYFERAVGLHALHDHGDLIHVRHQSDALFRLARLGCAQHAEHVAGAIDAGFVAVTSQFTLADVPDFILLPAGSAGQQQCVE